MWYDDLNNMIDLALWLDYEVSAFNDASEAILLFEKPQRFTRSYRVWQLYLDAQSDDEEDFIVEGEILELAAEEIENNWFERENEEVNADRV